MLEAVGAERAILATLMKQPDSFFSIDDIIEEDDFTNTGNRLIFGLMKELIIEDGDVKLDHFVLMSAAEERGLKDFSRLTCNGDMLEALNATKNSVNVNGLKKHVSVVKKASIKRALIGTLDNLKDDVEEFDGSAIDCKNMVEDAVLKSIKTLDRGDGDIVNLSKDFEEVINSYADRNATLGLDIGLERWQRDCAAFRNGTVTGVFARAKTGKSQLAAHALKMIGIEKGEFGRLPVLYLDTEMQARSQQMRLCSMMTGIPFGIIESGTWKSNPEQIGKIKEAFARIKDAPIYYKNIAGKSISHVIPVIRKFIHKYAGGETQGDEPRCLVIYDYIKLMNAGDLRHAQEYQILGFLLGAVHDLASSLNFPMLVLGQLNREALKTDTVGSVAGSDRITHNLDSLTLFREKRAEERDVDGDQRGTHILKAVLARNGPGHDYNEWVNLHFDKGAGQFKEDKRNTEVIAAMQDIHAARERLAEQELTQFADIRE